MDEADLFACFQAQGHVGSTGDGHIPELDEAIDSASAGDRLQVYLWLVVLLEHHHEIDRFGLLFCRLDLVVTVAICK